MLTVLTLLKTRNLTRTDVGERDFWATLGPLYLDRWIAGVRRHVPWPHEIVVMTDLPEITPGVRRVPLVGPGTGWWAKVEMFREDVSRGVCFWSDLDNVATGDLSALLSLTPEPLIMMEDRFYPGLANGSAMLFDADHPAMRALWTEYRDNPAAIERAFCQWPNAADQAYIADRVRAAGLTIPYAQDLLPPGYIVSSRDELEKGADWSQCRLLYGAGRPKPHESAHPIYATHWS